MEVLLLLVGWAAASVIVGLALGLIFHRFGWEAGSEPDWPELDVLQEDFGHASPGASTPWGGHRPVKVTRPSRIDEQPQSSGDFIRRLWLRAFSVKASATK